VGGAEDAVVPLWVGCVRVEESGVEESIVEQSDSSVAESGNEEDDVAVLRVVVADDEGVDDWKGPPGGEEDSVGWDGKSSSKVRCLKEDV